MKKSRKCVQTVFFDIKGYFGISVVEISRMDCSSITGTLANSADPAQSPRNVYIINTSLLQKHELTFLSRLVDVLKSPDQMFVSSVIL